MDYLSNKKFIAIRRALSFFFFFLSFISSASCQIDSFDNYEWRIKQSYLLEVYIPKNPQDAFSELKALTPESALKQFAAYPEDSIKGRLQLTLGKWITKNWQFYEGSRLSHYFKERGLSHPEDMAEFLIIAFHRFLNSKSIREELLIERLIERRKSNFFESRENIKKELIFTDTIEGAPPKE